MPGPLEKYLQHQHPDEAATSMRMAKLYSYMGVPMKVMRYRDIGPNGDIRRQNDKISGWGQLESAIPELKTDRESSPLYTGEPIPPDKVMFEALYHYDHSNPIVKYIAKKAVSSFIDKHLNEITNAPLDVPGLGPNGRSLRASIKSRLSDPNVINTLKSIVSSGDLKRIDSLPDVSVENMDSHWSE